MEPVFKEMPWSIIFFLFFSMVCGLGIINLLVGVMVLAGVKVIQSENSRSQFELLVKTKRELIRVKDLVFAKMRVRHKVKLKEHQKETRRLRKRSALSEGTAVEKNQKVGEKDKKKKKKTDRAEENVDTALRISTKGFVRNASFTLGRFKNAYSGRSDGGDDEGDSKEEAHDQEPDIDLSFSEDSDSSSSNRDFDVADERKLISMHELKIMLCDPKLANTLKTAGIRMEQVLLVFRKLDVRDANHLDLDEFIEGLMRMKEEVQGVDIAAGKSSMRRLVNEVVLLRTELRSLRQVYTGVVKRLRDVDVISAGSRTPEEQGPEAPQDTDGLASSRSATRGFGGALVGSRLSPKSGRGNSIATWSSGTRCWPARSRGPRNTRTGPRPRSVRATTEVRRHLAQTASEAR